MISQQAEATTSTAPASPIEAADIVVRPMRPDEKPAVRQVFMRSFSFLKRWFFFSWTPDVLVATRGEQLLGAVMLETYPLPDGRTGGFVTWVFTAAEARGSGAGQRLIEAALDLFESRGCTEVTTFVEGYNTSSSRLFATRGFSILSPGQQLRRYGLRTLAMWVRWRHLLDIGHFVWARPGAAQPDSPSLQWWGTLLANILIALLTLWRRGRVEPLTFLAVPLMCLLFLGARVLAMRQAAAAQGLELRYRTWETGFLVSLLVALLFRFFFPIPGSAYPASAQWSYRRLLRQLGRIALAGVLPTLALTGAAWLLARFAALPAALTAWLGYALFVGVPLALFDTVMIFFPFWSFNGRRIWQWRRPLWAVLALTALAMFFL